MLYRSINVAIIVLLSWFSYVSMTATQSQKLAAQQTQKQLSQSHEILLEKQQSTDERMAAFQTSLDEFLAAQKAQAAEKKKMQAAVAAQKQITSLHALYGKVLKADVLRSSGQAPEAATLLKSTKKEIWQTGDRYPKHQKALRGSMQVIDGLVKAWTAKDTSKSAAPVYKALEKVLIDSKG
ncbi:hypothetical protein EOL70_14580 [Leucothrix sargassi]|nr:hypothetical protein EOL70_14580 [Leucothrix sargassi]